MTSPFTAPDTNTDTDGDSEKWTVLFLSMAMIHHTYLMEPFGNDMDTECVRSGITGDFPDPEDAEE